MNFLGTFSPRCPVFTMRVVMTPSRDFVFGGRFPFLNQPFSEPGGQ